MNAREKILSIFNRKSDGTGAMWTGHPNDKTIPIYAAAWGIPETREAIYSHLDDNCRWFIADSGYHHPAGLPALDPAWGTEGRHTLSAGGCFAAAETVAEIDRYPWPDPDFCDFTEIYAQIGRFPDKAVFTGMWSPFFHNIADFFGMENYFVQMYENPVVVEAATERITDWYVAAGERFFAGLGAQADVMFFGNDFGTQRDLLISPESFRKFVLPSFKRLIALGKKHGKKILLHSCGSIYRIIPDLIDAGVDALHPIQAGATGMDAASLAQYKNDLAFVGGIDAQSFFVQSTPQQIRDEVHRVRDILGPNIVISPSHEEILPNVPPENVMAMAEAARD